MADKHFDILEAINRVKERLNITFNLKPEQEKVISFVVQEKKDCICVLPTGLTFNKFVASLTISFLCCKLNLFPAVEASQTD